MQSNNLHQNFRLFIIFAVGILFICWPAIDNGYPLVYADSGTYLLNSIQLEPAADRPVLYGLFIRLFSWQAITWNAVVAQAIVVWCITYRVFKLHFDRPLLPHLIALAILSFGSSLPWYAAQLMPDIFSGVIILLVYLLFADTPNWKRFVVYGVVFGFLVMTHFSYFVIGTLTTGVLMLCRSKRLFTIGRPVLYRTLGIAGILSMAVLVICTWNYESRGRFVFSVSSNVFLTAKFTDGGVLNTYLRDNCGRKNIPFCSLKDSTIGPMDFIWNSELDFQKKYHSDWEKASDSCAIIVNEVFSTAKYRNLFLREAWRATLQQLTENKIGSGLIPYRSLEGPIGNVISGDFHSELGQFLNAKQQNENMEEHLINEYIDLILIVASIISIVGLCVRSVRRKAAYLVIACLSGVVFNAFATAALANVYDRLQARVTWLVEFSAIIVLMLLFESWRKRHSAKGFGNIKQ